MNNQYMPYSYSMKIGQYRAQICYVTNCVIWTFWLKKNPLLVFKLYTKIDLKCSWNPKLWYLNVCINQWMLAIALEFTCAPRYVTDEGLKKCVDSICLTEQPMRNMDTKNIRNNASKYSWRTSNIGKQSRCLHIAKVQPKTRSWSTGLWLSVVHTYEQGVLERCLSGMMHIQRPHAQLVSRDSRRHN